MAASRTAGVWSRQRLATVLGLAAVGALLLVAGLVVTLFQLVTATKEDPSLASDRIGQVVTDRREEIAARQPAGMRKRQQALFARYDPQVSAEAFGGLLNLFGNPADEAARR